MRPSARWTLEGEDSGRLQTRAVLPACDHDAQVQEFAQLRNAPADADTDNTYMVTVKASYGSGTEMVMDTQDRHRLCHRRERGRDSNPVACDDPDGWHRRG